MIKSYLHLAIRNLFRHKAYSLINILSLSLGITCCIAIAVYIEFEFSYDEFHARADQTFRLTKKMVRVSDGTEFNYASIEHSITPILKEELPQITNIVRVKPAGTKIVRYDDKEFREVRFYHADASFFDVFSYDLIQGNPKTALTEPKTLVVTESVAKKYFGNTSAVGQTINVSYAGDYRVTGVIKDPHPNTHFKFDFISSLSSLVLRRGINDDNYYTYLVVEKDYSLAHLESRLKSLVERHGYNTSEFQHIPRLQRLTDIHLYSHLAGELEQNGNVRSVSLLAAIGVLILLVTVVNYVNLSTAFFSKRTKEIGLRKVFGSTRRHLSLQFYMEVYLQSLLSLIVSVCILELASPFLRDLTGSTLSVRQSFSTLLISALIVLVTGILAGGYPALFASRLQPAEALRLNLKIFSKGTVLRRPFLIVQFAVSLILMVCTVGVYKQLAFIGSKDLGFDSEQLVTFSTNISTVLKTEFLKDPRIKTITATAGVPGLAVPEFDYLPEGFDKEDDIRLPTLRIDHDFLKTFGIELLSGRNFSESHSFDLTGSFILNESAVKVLGWESPIGKKLMITNLPQFRNEKSRVIGVVKDFHFASLHEKIRPLVLGMNMRLGDRELAGSFTARVGASDVEAILSFLKRKTKELAPNTPFEFRFIDDIFDSYYRTERLQGQTLGIFCAVALILTCIGLFSLFSFIVVQRTKEIAIRKVLGASVISIIGMMNSELLRLFLLACLLGWPISYFGLELWLQNFAYRAELGIEVFIFATLFVIIPTLGIVSHRAYSGAKTNPSVLLRYE